MSRLFIALSALIVVCGCGSSDAADDKSVGNLPEKAPVTTEQQQAAQTAVANDPKAAADAPRPDGQ